MGMLGNVVPWKQGFLISDRYKHTITYITFDKKQSIIYGVFKQPNNIYGSLCAPHCVLPSAKDDGIFICDTLNGRVIELDHNNQILWQYGDGDFYGSGRNLLWHPNVVQPISPGKVLICDSMNNQVLIVDKIHGIEWEYGTPVVQRCEFKLPRSVQAFGESILVSDTHHHRVVEIDLMGNIKWEYSSFNSNSNISSLFFPRCANKYERGMLIADAGNLRIIKLNQERKVEKVYDNLHYKGNNLKIIDPHYILAVDNNTYLMVDSGQNEVVLFREDGSVIWKYDNLNDPHCATITSKNTILVADTGNNRIVELSCMGQEIRNFSKMEWITLEAPRFIGQYCNQNIMIDLNNDNRRVILSDSNNHVLSVLTQISNSIPKLNHSRWLSTLGSNIVVSDTGNSRLLLLKTNISNYSSREVVF